MFELISLSLLLSLSLYLVWEWKRLFVVVSILKNKHLYILKGYSIDKKERSIET